jgi:AraC family transcriptional regulator
MQVPETTSAENLDRYSRGKIVATGRGNAWRELKASIVALPPSAEGSQIPSVKEPFLVWVSSGEVEFQERENNGSWLTTRLKKGSFFVTFGGAPYECRWRTFTPEPFECMLVTISVPLFDLALEEVFGVAADAARLQDMSGFMDPALNSLTEQLYNELKRPKASSLFVQGIAQAVAIHLARSYTMLVKKSRCGTPSLPGYKLQRVTEWIGEHVAEDFDLAQLAALVGLSKYHFHRSFKKAIGVSPSCYHTQLRMELARKLLRETNKSVVEVAFEIGYASASHFAQLFRRQTGLSPGEYRLQL